MANKKKTKDTAAADISGRIDGEKVDGIQFVLGDRAAALLDQHLRDGLRMIMNRNAIKAQTIETVPFDIRFEVCHTLLTELRKKHALDVSSTKLQNLETSLNKLNGMSGMIERIGVDDLLLNSNPGDEASSVPLPVPPFIIYTRLGEDSLLTIVNAGRQIFNKRKHEGYQSTFNIKPMYTPEQEMNSYYTTQRKEEDDFVTELIRDESDKKKTKAAKISTTSPISTAKNHAA